MSELGPIAGTTASVAPPKKRHTRTVFTVLLSVFFGILMGGFVMWRQVSVAAANDDQEIRENKSGDFRFTNPLLECDNGSDIFQKIYSRVSKSDIQNLINDAERRGDISFASLYYRDLNLGGVVQIDSEELFAPASLLKIPLMMYWLKRSETEPGALQQEIQFSDDLHGSDKQYFKTPDPVQKGKIYTVDDLIRRAVAQSDNDAADALAQLATKPNLEKMFDELHVQFPHDGGNRMSVMEYARFFRLLFNASYLSRANSEHALQILSQNTFRKGLVAKLPSDVVVSHKFGERISANLADDPNESTDRQLHDCGIVYAPGRPYLLCIMTRGEDMDKLASTIADISKLVYDQVTDANK